MTLRGIVEIANEYQFTVYALSAAGEFQEHVRNTLKKLALVSKF